MVRRPKGDERQADFFGVPSAGSGAPEPRSSAKPKPEPQTPHMPAPLDSEDAPSGDGFDGIAARLLPSEWKELIAALSDEALAHVVIATARQLRRRLRRSSGPSGEGRTSSLERSAQQLIAELREHGDDDDWDMGRP